MVATNPPARPHWRNLSADPNAEVVREALAAELTACRAARISDTKEFLRAFVAGRSTLDVGMVQHVLKKTTHSRWKHQLIVDNASHTLGVDILEEEIQELARRGYNVRTVDATGDGDLGERFDRVVLGDVIEHVDSPVSLLRFCGRHLLPEGRLLVVTPNPMFIFHVLPALRHDMFIPNADHTAWVSPTMALELGHRAGLRLFAYHHTQGDGQTWKRRVAVHLLDALGLRNSEVFSGFFYYLFGLP